MDKEERKKKKILTDNRLVTVNKREMSFQGLAEQLENGEDGIYTMIANDKNIIFTPKICITDKDLEEIEALRELRESIELVEKQEKAARGKRRFLLKKQLIEMRQDQYVIKSMYHKPMHYISGVRSFSSLDLSEKIDIIDSRPHSNCIISLFNPKHISVLLCLYSRIKEEVYDKLWTDSYYLIKDLENLIDKTLKDNYPLYYDLLIYKIDGKQNIDIQQLLFQTYNIKYTVEYISSLWRKKIPKLIAEQAQKDYLVWHYTFVERGRWKKCSRCSEIKLAHDFFFSRNSSSKDGFYSICKECRREAVKKTNG